MSDGNNTTKTSKTPALFLVAFFIFWSAFYATLARGWPPNGDPVAYFLIASSISENRSIGLAEKSPVVPLEQGPDGKFYSKFGVGQSLLEVPFYIAGKALAPRGADELYTRYFLYFVAVTSVPAVSALTVIFFFLLAVELGYPKRTATTGALILGLATIALPYARFGFSEPLQACAITGAALFAVRARNCGSSGSAFSAAALAAISGAFIGVAFITKAANIYLAPLFALYLLLAGGRARANIAKTAAFCAALLLFVLVQFHLNAVRFGGPLDFGYSAGRDAAFGFNVSALSGLYGLLFSPGKSVFLYSPALAAAVAGAAIFHRERRAESLLVWTAAAATLLLYARWWAWHGDWAWGPRFLVPMTPLLALPLLPLLRGFSSWRPSLKSLFLSLLGLSLFIQALGSTVNVYEYIMLTRTMEPQWMRETPARAGMRDEMLAVHFAPEFSPVAGHWWLLKHTARRDALSPEQLRERMWSDFPWRSLMAYAPPPRPETAVGFDYWWLHFPRYFPASARWAHPLAATLAALAAVALAFCAFIALKTFPSQNHSASEPRRHE